MVCPKVTDVVSVPNGTPNGTLFVCVDNSYGKGVIDPQTGKRRSLEDCSRKSWTDKNLSASHAYNCDWLMARLHGRIVGVWKIDKTRGWVNIQNSNRKECFLLPVCEETKDMFLDKEVHLGRSPNTLRGYFI